MLDLTQAVRDLVAKHGSSAIAELLGTKPAVVDSWVEGNKSPSLEQLTKLFQYDPDPVQSAKGIQSLPPAEGGRLAICMNTNRAVDWRTMQSIVKLFDSAKMRLLVQPTNFLIRGRNQLAWSFLQTDCEWSLWVDDDMVLPCGDAAWFRQAVGAPNYPETYAGINTVYRLLHSGQKLVGGCYFSRFPKGRAQFYDAATSSFVDSEIHAQGPTSTVRPTKWVAAGCMLVHRDVFIDLAKSGKATKLPEEKEKHLRYRYGFFDPLEDGMGEDVSFCLRAAQAGHQPHIDLAVMPGHVGPHVFNVYNTR